MLWIMLVQHCDFPVCSPQDPEVMTAFQDVQKNPANISKYENNPKVKKVMEKLAARLGSK